MGKTVKRAVLLNKEDDAGARINKDEFKLFLKEFLKTSKKRMASPPTHYEKALIVAKPSEEMKGKSVKKVAILPELLKEIKMKPNEKKKTKK